MNLMWTRFESDFGSGWVLRVQIRVESGGVGPPGSKFGLSGVKLVKFGHTKAKYILYNWLPSQIFRPSAGSRLLLNPAMYGGKMVIDIKRLNISRKKKYCSWHSCMKILNLAFLSIKLCFLPKLRYIDTE